MTDTQPGGKLYDAQMQEGADLARKLLESDGPLHFTESETATLRVLVYGLQRALHVAQETNRVIGAALYRKNLTIVHHENNDGTLTVDLIEKPPDAPETVM